MSKITIIGKTILNELANFDETVPSLTIAKYLYKKFPEIFTDIEHARFHIRTYRGNIKGRNVSNKTFYRENRTPERALREYNFKPIDLSIKDFIFPHFKPLILSDLHIPYHAAPEIEVAIEHGLKYGIDSIYLNGDILDCARISKWSVDPRMVNFEHEREMFWSFIEFLQQLEMPIYFKIGNHEARIESYLRSNAPELAGLDELMISRLLHLEELAITVINDRQLTKMGKLDVIHGHEFGDSYFSPVNPARGLFLRAKSTALVGHNHQTSEHHENNLKGDSMACFSVGCLCNLRPGYRPFAYTKWNHGFAKVEIEQDGNFEVHNKRIIDLKVR